MGQITEILNKAQARAKQLNLSYEGALLPSEAHQLMRLAPGAKLVDVRTRAELDFVGRIPDTVHIEWATYPGMKPNPHFTASLEQQVDKESLVMFVCRTGGRSHNAAVVATQIGFADCYNVLEGFEGDKDDAEHRSSSNGWRAAGLPWVQG